MPPSHTIHGLNWEFVDCVLSVRPMTRWQERTWLLRSWVARSKTSPMPSERIESLFSWNSSTTKM